MSAIEKFIDKVEKALTNFIENDDTVKDIAVQRLKGEEESLLQELKSIRMTRSGRSLLSCGLLAEIGFFSAFGYAFAWPLPVVVIIAFSALIMLANLYSLYSINSVLKLLDEKHETLLIAMDDRIKRRERLLSNSKGESLILALDELDEKLPRESSAARDLIREHVKKIKRRYLYPMLNYRERKARYLLNQDPGGIEKEINEALHRQVALESELDMESSMIIDRTVNAKRETLERLADTEREFDTIELCLESVFSQVEQIEALIHTGAGDVDLDELTSIFEDIEHGLELAPGVPPKALPA